MKNKNQNCVEVDENDNIVLVGDEDYVDKQLEEITKKGK